MELEYRSLKQCELEKWLDHCNTVFKVPKKYFAAHFNNDPFDDLSGIFAAFEGDRIVSTVRVFRREVYLNSRRIPMGGIGEVSTKPSYRRKGISERLLKMAADYMKETGLAISELYTGTHHHYDRFGWQIVKIRHSTKPVSDIRTPLPSGTSLRPYTPSDLPAMRAIYDLYAGSLQSTMVRDTKGYWNDWMREELNRVEILEAEGRPVAYIDWKPGSSSVYVREFAAMPAYKDAFNPMVSAIADYEDFQNIQASAVLLPGGEEEEINHLMVRLITPFMLNGELIDTIEKLCEVYGDCTVKFEADSF